MLRALSKTTLRLLLLTGCSAASLLTPVSLAQESVDALAEPPPIPAAKDGVELELTQAQREMEQQRARKSEVLTQLAQLPAAQRELEHVLSREVRALYRLRRGGLLPVAGGLDALVAHASRVAHLERLARRTVDKLAVARKRSASLAKEAAELDAKFIATEREAQALEQKRASLAAEASAAAAFAAQQAQLSQRSEAVADARVSYGLTLVGGSERPSFAGQRGFLALPVAAATSISPVDPVAGGRRQGLLFETPPGASVRAAAAGRVAAVERTHDGVSITIDHGDRYQTVYGGLADSDLEIDDAISKSARVGSAGSQPVRFEVRRGSRNQDARSFLGL